MEKIESINGEAVTSEKKYTLRAPVFDDMFVFVKLLSAAGVKDIGKCFASADVKAAIGDDAKAADVEKVGQSVVFEVIGLVMANLENAKKPLYDFLERLSGVKAKDIASMPPAEPLAMIEDILTMREFADFFTGAMRLFNRMG